VTIEVRDIIRRLERAGWVLVRQGPGSHRQSRSPSGHFVITVSGKPGDDMPLGTLKDILRKSVIKLD
jgi:predicted RNA binding protein YcfA (HicA-like mRNA interferase family)